MGKWRLVIAGTVGAVLALSVGYGMQSMAQGSNTTYYGCLKNGLLSQVGTVSPKSCAAKHIISWNSQGPQGPQGPPGPPGATDVYQQQGSGGGNPVVVQSPVLPVGAYLVQASALVDVGAASMTSCTITTTGAGDSVVGNTASVQDPTQKHNSSGDAVLDATVTLTQSNDRVALTCGSDVDYSITEQHINGLVVN